MYATMVKHSKNAHVYWYEVPDRLLDKVAPGKRVMCKNARGYTVGTALSSPVEADECTIPVMTASGAVFPLCHIVDLDQDVYIGSITVPEYMRNSSPSNEKLAKRFLEYYQRGRFDTNVVIAEDGTLIDGYSAYVVAVTLGLSKIPAIIRYKEERKHD